MHFQDIYGDVEVRIKTSTSTLTLEKINKIAFLKK